MTPAALVRRTTALVLTRSPLAWLLLGLVGLYRIALSPALGQRCRFDPSCSSYAAEAVRAHGAVRGGWLALRRLLRCHPWGGAGHDPVPPARPARRSAARPPVLTGPSRGVLRVDHR